MPVKSLDATEELVVVADVDKDLGVGFDGGVEKGERPGGERIRT